MRHAKKDGILPAGLFWVWWVIYKLKREVKKHWSCTTGLHEFFTNWQAKTTWFGKQDFNCKQLLSSKIKHFSLLPSIYVWFTKIALYREISTNSHFKQPLTFLVNLLVSEYAGNNVFTRNDGENVRFSDFKSN